MLKLAGRSASQGGRDHTSPCAQPPNSCTCCPARRSSAAVGADYQYSDRLALRAWLAIRDDLARAERAQVSSGLEPGQFAHARTLQPDAP